jgi:hypothetical protein
VIPDLAVPLIEGVLPLLFEEGDATAFAFQKDVVRRAALDDAGLGGALVFGEQLPQHVVLLGEGFRQPQRCLAVAASESCDQIVARAGRRWDGEAEQHEKEDYVAHGISPGRGSGSPLIVSPTNRTRISLSFMPWPTARLAITPTAKASW